MRKTLLLMLAVLLGLALPQAASCEERPVLTIGDRNDRTGNRYDADLGLWQYLADRAGVEIRYIYYTPAEYDAALASGILPDIVATRNNLSMIRENNLALDVEPYLEDYVPNFLQGELRLTHDVLMELGNEGEGFYFFPAKVGYNGVGFSGETSARGYTVRWDYYKELGYPPVNSEDDYLDILLRMYENHPFTEEGYPTYLYGADNFTGYDTAFRAELSLDYWTSHLYQNNIFTNEIYDGYTDPAHSRWWTAKAWENKVYRAAKATGSYDMDMFTQTRQQFDAKCARGQYLGLQSAQESLYRESLKKDPDTLSGYAIIPTDAANYYTNVYQLLGNGPGYMWFISANSPNKEAALRLFNCMCDPDIVREICLGREGVTWYSDSDGTPRMTDYGREQMNAYKKGTASPDNYYVRWGDFTKLPSNWPLLRDNMTHPDGYMIDFATISRQYEAETMLSNISRDMCAHYGTMLPTDAFYKAGGLDFRNDCGEAISSAISSLNQDRLRVLADAEAILSGTEAELILAETDAEYAAIRDETIRKLKELGEPEVFAAYREKWDAAAEIIVPLVFQVQLENGFFPYTPEEYERFP